MKVNINLLIFVKGKQKNNKLIYKNLLNKISRFILASHSSFKESPNFIVWTTWTTV